jgi:hypothetical protein
MQLSPSQFSRGEARCGSKHTLSVCAFLVLMLLVLLLLMASTLQQHVSQSPEQEASICSMCVYNKDPLLACVACQTPCVAAAAEGR